MNMKWVLLVMGSIGAVLTLVLLWKGGAQRAPNSPLSIPEVLASPTGSTNIHEFSEPQEDNRQSTTTDTSTLSTPTLGAPDSQDASTELISEEQSLQRPSEPAEDLDAILRMLENSTFTEACASPKEVETELLTDLAEKADRLIDEHVREETARRVEAGLYEPVEGYDPNKTLTTPLEGPNKEILSYYIGEGQARRVTFTTDEYPYLYSMRRSLRLLDAELRSRGKSRRR
jgi:hypothetical protein